jgi:type I restriction enzyme M protein
VLDTDTKRRIDTARDILVGKVPDPKSQVEQITIALIYKFMDDMDAESEELGGKRKFFTKAYARYGWARLMAPSLGGHEMLGLYGEGISKMPENPGIPALFRDIFKNAYLPYRDPETLKAFLKIINEFSYDHSERLGDAFEYLLSVLGSQGDAGQFRTPRHIIDFMVEVVAPRKNETILDPACGTAGFLISAYKHILRTNTDAKGHSKLTPDEKGRLAKNFKGYDISPDMVRLSLVNLYLHGFTDPHIYEYDTLTSEERWNEFADVILANPPFMSPKGGIKPHKRFAIQAKRSEVLFVDYMAEHLTPTGRAGIIVPEGIIFQSQTAYKDLRKMLVENSLVAVVSLPAGCFNPYSGVKTSILLLDKSLARQSDTIAFFKVENDGFGLGAQRRAIEKNDLPQVQAELAAYLQALRAKASTESILAHTSTAQIVPKEKIAANGDYNLSGERYREGAVAVSSWPFVPVGDAFRKGDETVLPESLHGPVTYLGLENITQNTGEIEGSVVTDKPADIKSLKNVFKPRDILYGKLRPNLNKVWLADRKGICSTDIFVIEAIEGTTDPALYAYLFRSSRFNEAVMGQLNGQILGTSAEPCDRRGTATVQRQRAHPDQNSPAAAGGAEGDRGGDRGLPESHQRRPRRPRPLSPPHPHPPRLADGGVGQGHREQAEERLFRQSGGSRHQGQSTIIERDHVGKDGSLEVQVPRRSHPARFAVPVPPWRHLSSTWQHQGTCRHRRALRHGR